MKIPDLVDDVRAWTELRGYIRKQYENQYNSDMSHRSKEERAVLGKELVERMTATEELNEFKQLFRDGISRGRCRVKIETSSSFGFLDVKGVLLDATRVVPDRLEKVAILLLGRDRYSRDIVWNEGKSLFVPDTSIYDAVFAADASTVDAWAALKAEHRSTYKHGYRCSDIANQHGHCRSRPSYFALGFTSMEAFWRGTSEEEQHDYKAVHTACCGLAGLMTYKDRRAAIKAMVSDAASGPNGASSASAAASSFSTSPAY